LQIFFAIDEKRNENAEEVADGMQEASETRQKYVNENCVETVLQFCENELKIDDARTKVKVEKAYCIGKQTDGATKARPNVPKFSDISDRDYVRSVSNRLKGTKFGISPHYPQGVLEKRKKLVPIM